MYTRTHTHTHTHSALRHTGQTHIHTHIAQCIITYNVHKDITDLVLKAVEVGLVISGTILWPLRLCGMDKPLHQPLIVEP